MKGIYFLNAYSPKSIIEGNTINKGNYVQAKVLSIFQDEIFLQIRNEKILAKINGSLPQITEGKNLRLLVTEISADKMVLSLNTKNEESENFSFSILNLLKELNLEENEENKLILNKLLDEKIKLSKEVFKNAATSLQLLPVEAKNGLDLLTNPTLITAIFNFFYNPEENFTISMFKEENKDIEAVYDINILYSSPNMGYVLSNIKWSNNLNIEIICSEIQTVQLINNQKEELCSKLKSFSELRLQVSLDKDLLKKINSIKDNKDNTKYKGIDLRI